MKTILEILTYFVILFSGFMIGYVFYHNEPVIKLVPVVDPNYVQNIGEAQQRLKEQGLYHGKIDYKWGEMTDKAYCDWMAIQEFRQYGKKLEK